MATNNIILAVPGADTSVDYTLPGSDSAQLSFTPEDIDGLKLDANGGLVISFAEGGQVTLKNFQSFIDNGNTLSLADGTQVDPKLLFNALGGQSTNPFPTGDVTHIAVPEAGVQRDITLDAGKKYLFDFDLSETKGADVKDGQMVVDFKNGGKIVIANYETAMAGATPPELSLASKTCVVSGDELITNIQDLAKAGAIAETAIVLEEEKEEDAKSKSKIVAADMAGKDDIGANDETGLGYRKGEVKDGEATEAEVSEAKAREANEIKTAAGDDAIAAQLANIETAAGGGAAGGARNSGYGYRSSPGSDPFVVNRDIGPLDPTQLNYRAPILEPARFLVPEEQAAPDTNPIIAKPDAKYIDETNLGTGPVSISGELSINYGADGPGGVTSNGNFDSSGSLPGGNLTSNGDGITITLEGNNYVGKTAGGDVVFELVVDPTDGDYTFTQYLPLDHADGSDANDQISLVFGVTARDGDGDPVSTTIQIIIADDGPSASGASETIDETDLGPIVETGSITVDFGQDGAGKVETTDVFTPSGSMKNDALTTNGVPVVVTSTPTGYVGTAGGATVFTLTLNAATGEYVFTLLKNLDHGDNNDANDIITLTFGTKVIDYDGDTAPANIVINIKDDVPIFQPPFPPEPPLPPEEPPIPGNPTPDHGLETVDESNLAGPVVETGTLDADFGADSPGTYAFIPSAFASNGSQKNDALTHNGVPVVVTIVDGQYVGKAGDVTVFTLDLNTTTGDYKFTLLDNLDHADATNPDDSITLHFGVRASDSEGEGADGSIQINVKDDAPVANDDHNTYDTTFGVANGNVISGLNGGAGAADDLSTDATNTVVKVAFGGNVIDVPAAGTTTIDGTYGKLTIAANGTYTYQLNAGVVPGAGGTGGTSSLSPSSSDVAGTQSTITKNGITVTSSTGTDLTFVSSSDGNGIGIAGQGSDKIHKNEKVVLTFGDDIVKADITLADIGVNNLDTGVEYTVHYSNGTSQTFEMSLHDLSITNGVGTFSINTIAGQTIDKIEVFSSDTGAFAKSSLLLADVKVYYPAAEICIEDKFVYTLQDSDGDTDPATLTLCGMDLTDDVPVLIQPAAEIVDETNLTVGVLTETGNILVDYGNDVAGAVTANGSFTSGGSKLNNALTHKGVPVVVSLAGDSYVGKAGAETIFTLKVLADGSYTFKLFDNLDHKDGKNPDDVITLNFGITATDGDGDTATTTVVVRVHDDAPVAHNDINTYDTNAGTANGNVISGLNGGTGAADTPSTDADNKIVKIAFEGNDVDVPSTGTVTIDGAYGKLTIAANGTYTYEAFDGAEGGAGVNKTFVAGPALPDFDESEALDGVEQQSLGIAPGNLSLDAGDTVSVKFISEGAGYDNSLGVFTVTSDGRIVAEKVLIGNGNTEVPGSTYSYTAGADAVSTGFFLLTEGARLNPGVDLTVGTINFMYGYGTIEERQAQFGDDGSKLSLIHTSTGGVETELYGELYFTTDRGGVENMNDDQSVRVVSGVPGDDNEVLRIAFEDLPQLGDKDFNDIVFDISINDKDCGCNDGAIKDVFTYTLADHDGDKSDATLTLNGKDMIDDKPVFATPATETVDETNLGPITETGTVTANFGADGPGTFAANGTFSSTGSKLDNVLSSNGVPVQVTLVNNMYVGKAGAVPVFTLTLNADGSYSFKLLQNLDHADGTNANDEIALKFGLNATDCDGDTANATLTVKVRDDAPTANDDTRTLNEAQTITGTVTSNDQPGQDNPATVTKVVVGGTPHTLPTDGSNIVIIGTQGTLTINNTGTYSYTGKPNADGVDSFTYSLTDRDGDTATAILKITVNDIDTCPVIVKPAAEVLDETALKDGVITETGTVTADFKDDGPGTFAGTGSFTSGGSKLNDALTHNGTAIAVTMTGGNTYTGKAGSVTVFTLVIAANGGYTFKLFEQLDHKDGTNADDIINLNFGIKAVDTDGDSDATTITINVKDDAPDAKDDFRSADEGQTITGNVTSNDVPGQDTPATVTKVVLGTTSYDVPTNGSNVVVVGTQGTLTINNAGVYSYTAKANADGIDSFTYSLKDRDGDIDTAILKITITDTDTCPVIVKPAAEVLDETALKDGVITETGTVTADFKDDGPGTFAANGSFTSGGSRLGDALTSGGVPIVVTQTGNTYTGKAGSATVFTLVIAANGDYTFKLLEQLDHKDATNADDIINLNFGIKAVDTDGDSDATTITIHVKDDAPDAKDDTRSVGESQTITGNVTDNDVPGQDTSATVTKVLFNGVNYDVPTTGTVTIAGVYGTLKIAQTGDYNYTAKSNNPDGTDKFTYTLKDSDGDVDTAKLEICVNPKDDTPAIVTPATEIVDETNLNVGAITKTGTVTANFFSDGPGTFAATGAFTSGGSKLNNALTHNGTAVVVTQSGNTYTGKAGSVTVFTLVIAASGAYTFKLLEQLDHKDGTNANDIIDLNFGVKAVDADGDSMATSIKVQVKDDAPIANDDHNNFALDVRQTSGNVVTGQGGGLAAMDTLSQDVTNKLVKVAFGSNSVDVPTTGTTTINGTHGKLTIASDGTYSYKLFDSVSNGAGSTKSATFTAADVAGIASSVTKNGITIASKNGADLTFVSNAEGNGDGVGIDGLSSPKIYNGEVMGITFGANIIKAEVTIADIGANNLKTGFEYRLFVAGSTTPISGEVGFKSVNVVNGVGTYTFDTHLTGGKEITKIEIYSSNEGAYKQSSLVLDAVKVCYPDKDVSYSDDFTYTLQDRDGDKDTAVLTVATSSENDLVTGNSSANTLHGYAGHDQILGNDGNDAIYGDAGNDLIIGGKGNDTIYGGAGADTFLYNAINEGVDRIKDFNQAEGDKFDLSGMISSFDPVTDAINDFVFTSHSGGNTTLSVNAAGTGIAGATAIAILEGTNVNVSDLFNNGSIIV